MDKKTKILFGILIIMAITSIGVTFYKTIILQDFETINTEEGPASE